MGKWGTAIKTAVFGWLIKDVAPIVLSTVKAVVLAMASTTMTGAEKKAAAMSAIKQAFLIDGVNVTVDAIDEAIEAAVIELKV